MRSIESNSEVHGVAELMGRGSPAFTPAHTVHKLTPPFGLYLTQRDKHWKMEKVHQHVERDRMIGYFLDVPVSSYSMRMTSQHA